MCSCPSQLLTSWEAVLLRPAPPARQLLARGLTPAAAAACPPDQAAGAGEPRAQGRARAVGRLRRALGRRAALRAPPRLGSRGAASRPFLHGWPSLPTSPRGACLILRVEWGCHWCAAPLVHPLLISPRPGWCPALPARAAASPCRQASHIMPGDPPNPMLVWLREHCVLLTSCSLQQHPSAVQHARAD